MPLHNCNDTEVGVNKDEAKLYVMAQNTNMKQIHDVCNNYVSIVWRQISGISHVVYWSCSIVSAYFSVGEMMEQHTKRKSTENQCYTLDTGWEIIRRRI
jgi:hypothetical protein